MKKLFVAMGLFLGFIGVAVMSVLFFVDIDKYRPKMVETINQNIRGQLNLGKLSWSLWGHIWIKVAGLTLQDSAGKGVMQVQDAYFELPFLPLLSGSPVLTFKMNQPTVHLSKNKRGQLNVMSLIQQTPAQSPVSASPVSPSSSGTSPLSNSLPSVLTRARLGVELDSASVQYTDESTGLSTQIKDMNLVLRNISLSHPIELELWAHLDTRLGNTLQLRGPVRLTGQAQIILKEAKIQSAQLHSRLDMDAVEISASDIFQKQRGVPAHLELALFASEKEIKIEKLDLQFFNIQMGMQGEITNLASAHFKIQSNSVELAPWTELIPPLKQYQLGGSAQFEAEVNGSSEKLKYNGKIIVSNLTAKSPQLKVQPKIDGIVRVSTDQVDQILLTLKAPANDLKIQGKIISFVRPQIHLEVSSTGLDLDQLIEFPPLEKNIAPAVASSSEVKKASSTTVRPDLDALLAPLRENKVLADTVASLTIQMKLFQAKKVKLNDLLCKMSFSNLSLGLDSCNFKVFGGTIQADAHAQLRPKIPTYQFHTQIADLDLSQALESQMALVKNTLTGKTFMTLKGEGSSLNSDLAIPNLRAKGSLKVTQATFTTIDVMKMVGEATTQAMNQIGNQVPGIKGKSIGNLPNHASQYEFVESDFMIHQGKFSLPNFYAKAVAQKGTICVE